MIGRRDVLLALACFAAAGAAEALKPRRYVSLLAPRQSLDKIVPRTFGAWQSRDISDQFAPDTQDSLQARLYGETIARIYHDPAIDIDVAMVMAHGSVQNNELQLHRPEVCYPAYGFEIIANRQSNLTLAARVLLPARTLVAKLGDHQETITYWTRLGEDLPISESEQHLDRIRLAIQGLLTDGVLARFSVIGGDAHDAKNLLEEFIDGLLKAVPQSYLPVLIGTAKAEALIAALRLSAT